MIAFILGLLAKALAKALLLLPALACLNALLMAIGAMADQVAVLLGKPDAHPLAKPIAAICKAISKVIDLISANIAHK